MAINTLLRNGLLAAFFTLVLPSSVLPAAGEAVISADRKERIVIGDRSVLHLAGDVLLAPFPDYFIRTGSVLLAEGGSRATLQDRVRVYCGPLILHASSGTFDRTNSAFRSPEGVLYLAGSSIWGVQVSGVLIGPGWCEFTRSGTVVKLALPSGSFRTGGQSCR